MGPGNLGEIPENVLIGNKLKSEKSSDDGSKKVIDAFSSDEEE
jgi:hypothetical protein